MSYPSVSHLPISEIRRKKVIENVLITFRQTAISRCIVEICPEKNGTDNFGRLGLNLIIDKIWFVDSPPRSSAEYFYGEIGEAEGKEIALSETKIIIDRILNETTGSGNVLERPDELDKESLQKAIAWLRDRGYECESILVDIRDIKSFWLNDFQPFVGVQDRTRDLFGLEGYFSNIPVYWSNFLPEKTTLLLNRKCGKLLIKKDLTANLSEIQDNELSEVLKSLPQLDAEKLHEKVRLRIDEIIRFDFEINDAAVALKSPPFSSPIAFIRKADLLQEPQAVPRNGRPKVC